MTHPNTQGPFGNTLLHSAAADGDVGEVQRLLAAGADPRITCLLYTSDAADEL